MPKIQADEVITQKHKRNYIQFGGPRPNNVARYAGQDAQYMKIEGVGVPESGGVDPIWVADPRRIGQYRLVGRKITPPDLASATLVLLERHGSIPKQLLRQGCAFNLYEATGECKDLSDFLGGWTDHVLIYSGAITTGKDLGDRSGWDSDDQIEDSLDITLADVYPVGALAFGEQAATQVDREVVDIAYCSSEQCGDCGPADDGSQRIYAVTKSSGGGSPGLPAEVIYSVDGGLNWSQANITGMGASEDPAGIDCAGDKLIIFSGTAIYWATINSNTGAPGTFTKVTTGIAASKDLTDVYVASPREIYFSALGGYIYKSTDITGGVTVLNAGAVTTADLFRIHGYQDTLALVGASSTVLKSVNRGSTFAATDASPSGLPLDIRAVFVMDKNRFWVGTSASGRLFYTLNGGASWTEKSFSGSGSGNLYDIVAASDEVLFFSHSTNTPTARIFTSWNGGADWTNTSPRILNLPTFNRANRLAVPNVDNPGVAANNLSVAGLSGGGTDGIILLGIASQL